MKTKKTKSKSIYKKISMKYYIPAFILLLAGIFCFSPVRGMVAHKLAVQGKYYFNGGAYDLDKAVKWYKAAAFVDDKSWIAHYQLARIYFVKNDLKTALAEIDKALAVDPKNKRAYYVRGLIDGYAKDYKASEDDFQKYVDYYQKEWAGYNDLAWAYFQDKDYQKAVDTALKGLEVAPDNPWLLNGLGVSYDASGEKEKGKAALDKVATIAKDMTAADWRKAYPGNNPETADWDLAQFKVDVGANLKLTSLKFSSGQGKFAAACGGSFGTMGQCSGCTCNWGYQCDMGDDPYSHLHSWGGFLCSSGCGSDAQCCPPPPAYCGDGSCNGGEDCLSCPGDCNPCPGGCAGQVGQTLCSTAFSGPACTYGVSPVNPRGTWAWDCPSPNGGPPAIGCTTNKIPDIQGQCGLSNNGTYCASSQITAPCSTTWGNSAITYNNTDKKWYWTCNGQCAGGNSPQCFASMGPVFDAKVGSADGTTFCNGWAANDQLCAIYSSVIRGSNPGLYGEYTWTCKGGQCGGNDASGTAKGKGSCGWIETN